MIWVFGVIETPAEFAYFASAFLGTIGGLTVTSLILAAVASQDMGGVRNELALKDKVLQRVIQFILTAERDKPPQAHLFTFAVKLADKAKKSGVITEQEYEGVALFFKSLAKATE